MRPVLSRQLSGLFALFAILATATAHPTRAEGVELRVATLAPSGSPAMAVHERAAAEIREKTSGRVTVRYYEGGSQGDERDFVRKIQTGQIDGAHLTGVGLSMIDPSIRVLELPGLFASLSEVDFVAGKLWPTFSRKFERKGFRLGARGEVGWVYLYSKTKVDNPTELRTQKPWVWGDDRIMQALFTRLGAQAVPLGVPEVDASLTSGRINACYGAPTAAVALQWYTKIRHALSLPLYYAAGGTVFSLTAWKKISAADQKIVASVDAAAAKRLRKVLRKANTDALLTMQRRGVSVNRPTPAASGEFESLAPALWQTLAGKQYTQAELNTVLARRSEYRARTKK